MSSPLPLAAGGASDQASEEQPQQGIDGEQGTYLATSRAEPALSLGDAEDGPPSRRMQRGEDTLDVSEATANGGGDARGCLSLTAETVPSSPEQHAPPQLSPPQTPADARTQPSGQSACPSGDQVLLAIHRAEQPSDATQAFHTNAPPPPP